MKKLFTLFLLIGSLAVSNAALLTTSHSLTGVGYTNVIAGAGRLVSMSFDTTPGSPPGNVLWAIYDAPASNFTAWPGIGFGTSPLEFTNLTVRSTSTNWYQTVMRTNYWGGTNVVTFTNGLFTVLTTNLFTNTFRRMYNGSTTSNTVTEVTFPANYWFGNGITITNPATTSTNILITFTYYTQP